MKIEHLTLRKKTKQKQKKNTQTHPVLGAKGFQKTVGRSVQFFKNMSDIVCIWSKLKKKKKKRSLKILIVLQGYDGRCNVMADSNSYHSECILNKEVIIYTFSAIYYVFYYKLQLSVTL